jgi:hypothetical protein
MDSNSLCTNINRCSASQASSSEADRDAKFLAMLPRIRRQAAYRLRRLPTEERVEAIQEVVASAFVSYVRLIERGKAELAFAGPLARFGACQYFRGRKVGNRMNACDITSDYCQRKTGVSLERLNCFDKPTDEWQEIVVEDQHSGPAEVAAIRVDFAAWLQSLPVRTRQVAETLATGEATGDVARLFGCSASRISQFRRELFNAWQGFQGEAARATSSALA